MDKEHLRTGDKASCRFRFIKNPEYMHADTRMVFREGRTKAIGTITKIYPYVPGGVAGSSSAGVLVPAASGSSVAKKKPSQVPKSTSAAGGIGRAKGRRGRNKGRVYHQGSVDTIEHKPQ